MPNVDFFTRLGIFAIRNFFEPSVCEELISEMTQGHKLPAPLATSKVNVSQRKATEITTSSQARELVEKRIWELKPALEKHFSETFENCEEPQFLWYCAGDFHRIHADRSTDPDHADYAKRRVVTIIIFLNSMSQKSYEGGRLTLYGLKDDPAWKSIGFQLEPEPGLLIAFRSELLHEVSPVVEGERFSIVGWVL